MDRSGSTQPTDITKESSSGSTRIDVDPRDVGLADPFGDPILRGLIAAQTTWLVNRDAGAVRRELVALLARLV